MKLSKSLIIILIYMFVNGITNAQSPLKNTQVKKLKKSKKITDNQIITEDYLSLKLEENELDLLVEHAIKNSYVLKALAGEAKQKKEKIKQQNLSFLQNFDIGLQLYNFSQDFESATTVSGLLPNMGLNMKVNLFGIATYRSNVRYAKADLYRTQNDILQQKKILRNWLEAKYSDYLLSLEMIEIRSNILVAIENQLVLEKERFKRGEGKIEDYLKALNGTENIKASLLRSKNSAKKLYREIIIFTTP